MNEYIPHAEDWPHQTHAVSECVRWMNEGKRRFCFTSPTGAGKGRTIQRICEYGVDNGLTVGVMSNRRLLTDQLLKNLHKNGIEVGCRAADFEAWTNPGAPVQVISIQTETSRVLNARTRGLGRDIELVKCDILIPDEAHLVKGPNACKIFDELREKFDTTIIGSSATPLGIGQIYTDGLIVAGNNTELRACGALVWANRFEPCVMDLHKVKFVSQAEAERTASDRWGQHVVASILRTWKQTNPDARPSIGMAPGVPESLGIAQDYWRHGINAAHIDAEGIFVNGEYKRTNEQRDRDELFAMLKDGTVPQIWNRYVCLDADTEILTEGGWKGIDEMLPEDLVANWSDGKIHFEKPQRIIRRNREENERMVVLETPRRSIRVTETHELLFRNYPTGNFMKSDAACLVGSRTFLPVSGYANPIYHEIEQPKSVMLNLSTQITKNAWAARKRGDDPKTSRAVALERIKQRSALRRKQVHELSNEECEFIGFWIGDGDRNKKKDGALEYRIAQAESSVKIVARLESIFHAIGIDFRKHVRTTNNPEWKQNGNRHLVFSFARGTGTGKIRRRGVFHLEPYLNKDGTELYWGFNEEQFKAFIRGLWMADGMPHNDNTELPTAGLKICGVNTKLFDLLQAIAVCRGYRASIRSYKQSNPKYKTPILTLSLSKTEHHELTKYRLEFDEGWNQERVWCVTTSSGNIITRRHGSATVMGNCREGIDLPWLYLLQLATPIVDVKSYVQVCGRVLRAHPSKTVARIVDHAGCIRMHGSPNGDRDADWAQYFFQDENKLTEDRHERMTSPDKKQPEPITCPKCGAMRDSGPKCTNVACGHEHEKSIRQVIQEDGTLKPATGDVYKRRQVSNVPDVQKKWNDCFFAALKSGHNFKQAIGNFVRKYHCWPPDGLAGMPIKQSFLSRRIDSVPRNEMHGMGNSDQPLAVKSKAKTKQPENSLFGE